MGEGPKLFKTFLGEAGFQVFTFGKGDVRLFIAGLIQTTLGSVALLFFLMMLYGGILWFSAGGNDEKVTKARTIMGQAVVGFIITLTAFIITRFAAELIISASVAPPNTGTIEVPF